MILDTEIKEKELDVLLGMLNLVRKLNAESGEVA